MFLFSEMFIVLSSQLRFVIKQYEDEKSIVNVN